jgi:hypothetical protein
MSIFSKLLNRGPEDGDPASDPASTEGGDSLAPAGLVPAEPAQAAPTPATPARTGKTGKYRAVGLEPRVAPVRTTAPAQAARPATGLARTAAAPLFARAAVAKPATPRTISAVAAPVVSPFQRLTPAAARVTPAVESKGRSPSSAAAEAVVTIEAEPAESLDGTLERLVNAIGAAESAQPAGELTASDLQAVLATFEDLAVGHAADVRNLMMEVRWGEAQTSWFELARPALKSLRAMAGQVGHATLCTALDGFCVAVDGALAPGTAPTVGPTMRDKLLAAYAPLTAALPRAFELQGERDRREPLVVRALLGQVQGLEPLMIDKLIGAGLGRLEPLLKARADEVAAVAGIPREVATAVVVRVQAWKRETPAVLATPDRTATARELIALVRALADGHRAFEDAARGWSEIDRDAKKRLRRQRDVSFLQITIVLARFGEVDLALALEKLSFARRLEELGRLVSRFPAAVLFAAPAEGPAIKFERDTSSGAPAAP